MLLHKKKTQKPLPNETKPNQGWGVCYLRICLMNQQVRKHHKKEDPCSLQNVLQNSMSKNRPTFTMKRPTPETKSLAMRWKCKPLYGVDLMAPAY
jgi:hypothetical protein